MMNSTVSKIMTIVLATLLVVSGFFVFTKQTFAADTGQRNPTVAESVGVTGTGWSGSTVNNALIVDGNDADLTSALAAGATSKYLKLTGFGFSIPSDATIIGIKVSVTRRGTSDSAGFIKDGSVILVGGVGSSADKASSDAWSPSTTVFTTKTYGGETDMWATTWTSIQINNAAFGLEISAQNTDTVAHGAHIDGATITVYYTSGGPNYTTIFSDIKTTLAGQGIDTNIDTCASTPTECIGLYFEKRTNISDINTALGRVTFTASLNLTDSATNTFLQNLGTYMEANAGSLKFNAQTASQLQTAGAVIKMYGFTHGDGTDAITQSELVVKNDNGVVIDPGDAVNYPTISSFTWDNSAGTVTFSASHFTQFYLNDTIKPSIVSFSIPATSSSLTVSGITVTAHDNRGVAGLMFSESNTPPLASSPNWSSGTLSTYIFDSAGAKTLYAWAKDAADNVSNVYDGKAVTITTDALSSAKAITAFSFPSGTGVINETAHTISVNVPNGTDVTALVATFITTGSSVAINAVPQVSATTANDFSSTKTYTVTAADSTTQGYVVTVTVLENIQTTNSSGSGGGGGGSTANPLSNLSMVINNNTATTNDRNVTLTMTGVNAAQMIIANDTSFTGANWETFISSKVWTLSEGVGTKNVYVKFRNSYYIESSMVSDAITFAEGSVLGETTAAPYPDGTIIMDTSDNRTIYVIESGKKRGFTCWPVFVGMGYKPDNVLKVDLSDYEAGEVIQDIRSRHPNGTLILSNGTVWEIKDNQRRGIPSVEIFNSYGYNFGSVVNANSADLELPEGLVVVITK